MSTFEPSASLRPLVMSGIAGHPACARAVAAPPPVLLNQVSSVNWAAPRLGAAPIVTYWLEPLNSNACGPEGTGVATASADAVDAFPTLSTATTT